MSENVDTNTNILLSLRKFLAPEVVYGEGAIELAGQHASNLGATKVFIVTDPGVQEAGWTARVTDSLRRMDIPYCIFSDNTQNPKDYEVMAGADLYNREKCDLIIAVGGGSPMDCAKGIGIVAGNSSHVLEFEGVDEVAYPGPPLIFIPTTAGSSADVSQFAIIADSKRKVKVAIISKMVIPDIALVDPDTTVSMSPELTAATGMDALCHAIEAYVSTASSPLTDMAAISAVELISKNITGAYRHPEDMSYRNNMMMASLMAGFAFSNASLGLVHAMAHSLGGLLGLAHGECNAILLEQVVAYNFSSAAERYSRLAKAMGLDIDGYEPARIASALVERLASLRKEMGITQRLSSMGVSTEDISRLAGFAFQDPCLATNPREANTEEIGKIYERIF